MIFQNRFLHPSQFATQIDNALNRLLDPTMIQPSLNIAAHQPSMWIPPLQNHVKINVNISFLNVDTLIGIGFIIRTSDEIYVKAETKSEYAGNAEEAECRGILEAIKEGIIHQLRNIELETDDKAAANYLAGKPTNVSWTAANILDEVKH
ncbi:hypothetical protein FRX31_026715 [Thalictrum thalictroides]|uniref:RNase H type-1 domain-containing protein n=1 Tax=Thalictrum thalictroides TaxID=46969 RepID=A0A7J6VF03_THATH|nr:hypothetical protein FRX31_026715 [Thalictrum thalictroides]